MSAHANFPAPSAADEYDFDASLTEDDYLIWFWVVVGVAVIIWAAGLTAVWHWLNS